MQQGYGPSRPSSSQGPPEVDGELGGGFLRLASLAAMALVLSAGGPVVPSLRCRLCPHPDWVGNSLGWCGRLGDKDEMEAGAALLLVLGWFRRSRARPGARRARWNGWSGGGALHQPRVKSASGRPPDSFVPLPGRLGAVRDKKLGKAPERGGEGGARARLGPRDRVTPSTKPDPLGGLATEPSLRASG